MGLDVTTIEGLAVDFYRRLQLDPALPVDTFRLARMHLGPDSVEYGVGLCGERAKTFVVHGRRRIAISRRLKIAHAQHAVGHELAHGILDDMGHEGDDTERICDHLGAALMAPRPAALAMMRVFGLDHEALADEVAASHAWAALRIAEVLRIPRAVLTPRRAYARGPESFEWGTEEELRQMARAPHTRPGIVRTRLADDRQAFLLEVDATMTA